MCGIAGCLSVAPLDEGARPRLERMAAAIAHRGPDGSGTHLDRHVGLAHVRLAIIDLEQGAQPLAIDRGRLWISFNGEVYNYRELREGLIARGCTFATRSDTEVVLRLYAEEGIEGFRRLRGMYAFAIHDRRDGTSLLVRDPLGIKPLFWRRDSGRILFGSEAKAILAWDGERGALDPAALHLLLNFRYIPGELSLFRGVEQLPPGGVLRWSPALGARLETLPLPEPGPQMGILDALEESVRLHLTADVEVGCYLSGGIDSGAVTALARRHLRRPLRTFTLAVGDDPREAENASESARLLGVENLRGGVTEGVDSALPRLIRHLETPKVNALQVSALARHTSPHVKVALSGLGGDELFYGYNLHRILHRAEGLQRWLPRFASQPIGHLGAALLRAVPETPWTPPWGEPERGLELLSALGDWPRAYGLLRNLWDRPDLRRRIYGPRMLDARLPDPFAWLADRWPAGADPVAAAARFEWRNKMVNDLLWQEDRASMAEGLEVRVPFVDLVFAQQIQGRDRATLMPGGRAKGALREALRPLLPGAIFDRPKSGFQVPARAFFEQQLAPLAETHLSRERVERLGLFNPGFIAEVRAARGSTRLRWHYFILYLMLCTHLWIEQFEEPPR